MNEWLMSLIAGLIAIFATMTGSFSGGATSLIMFPLIMMFVMSDYMDALTVNKIATVFMTIAASKIHYKRLKINIPLFVTFLISGLIGTAIGTYIIQYYPNDTLFKQILAASLIGMGVYMFFSKDKGVRPRDHRKIGWKVLVAAFIFSLGINVLNGIFGGTGLLMTLFFVLVLKTTYIESMIYTMPVYAIINVIQTTYLVHTTGVVFKYPLLAITMACCGLLGGIIGTNLQYLKGNTWVKRVSFVAMLAIGIKMFWG